MIANYKSFVLVEPESKSDSRSMSGSTFENPNIPTSSGANAKKKEEVVVLVDSEEELLALPTERDREREREKEAASKKPVFSNILLLTKDSNKEVEFTCFSIGYRFHRVYKIRIEIRLALNSKILD